MVNLNIRKIELKDFDFIYDSICNLQNEKFEKKNFEKIFTSNISNPNYLYLIAENKTESIGFLSFHTQHLLHHSGIVGEIQEFYLVPDKRGQGIGRKLVEKIFEFCDENNIISIEVSTSKKRVDNIAVYENLGFKLSHNKFTIYK